MSEFLGTNRQFFRRNSMLDALVEQQILLMLMDLNPDLKDQLYYQLKITVHSVEIVDDDFLIAHVEHQLLNEDLTPLNRPLFCQVELVYAFVDLALFNNEYTGDNGDDEFVQEAEVEDDLGPRGAN